MVDWDSKDRGYPIEAESGTRGCYLSCLACKRTVRMLWADIVATWGVGTYTGDIARSLKCTACGERKGSLMAWTESYRREYREANPDTCARPIIGAIKRK